MSTDVGTDTVFGHAAATFTAVSDQGERLLSETNRLTVNLARPGDAWKIVLERSSWPIDRETGNAIFGRPKQRYLRLPQRGSHGPE